MYIPSSCQFVVCDDQDYTVHFTDPDTLVNWDFVEQVVSSNRFVYLCVTIYQFDHWLFSKPAICVT